MRDLAYCSIKINLFCLRHRLLNLGTDFFIFYVSTVSATRRDTEEVLHECFLNEQWVLMFYFFIEDLIILNSYDDDLKGVF